MKYIKIHLHGKVCKKTAQPFYWLVKMYITYDYFNTVKTNIDIDEELECITKLCR